MVQGIKREHARRETSTLYSYPRAAKVTLFFPCRVRASSFFLLFRSLNTPIALRRRSVSRQEQTFVCDRVDTPSTMPATRNRGTTAVPIAAMIIATALMMSVCAVPASAVYQPTGSPTISIGDSFALYSAYYQSFCYWQNLDPQMIYDWENIKCNVGADDLTQATRFIMTAPYVRQVCGRVPMSPYNISISFDVKHKVCLAPDRQYRCRLRQATGTTYLINCGGNDGNDPVRASFVLRNTATPPYGADGWLHGGEVPVTMTSMYRESVCGVGSDQGKIFCPNPGPAAASVFHLIPVDPQPEYEC